MKIAPVVLTVWFASVGPSAAAAADAEGTPARADAADPADAPAASDPLRSPDLRAAPDATAEDRPAAESGSDARREPERNRIEEIVVTAQKRTEFAQDVPISMSVMNDEFTAQRGIVDIVQAMQYVPNVKVASAGFFAAPQARGFSFNNLNLAFESPLGIAFDGIPYNSTTYFNAGLFDLSRVEVLRGPQGTTFGKNTTAGLVHVLTADPTSSYSGVLSLQGGEFGRRRVEAALGGPVPLANDFVEFRIAGLKDEHGGFVRNTTAAVVPGVEEELRGYGHQGIRGRVKFPDLWGSSLKVSYESVDLDSLGAGAELWHVTPTVGTVFRRYDPNADFVLGNYTSSEDFADNRLAHANTVVGEWNRRIFGWDVTLVGGHSVLSETFLFDVDFSPAPAIAASLRDDFPTTTVELRGQAPALEGLFGLAELFGLGLGKTEFLGGLFYQRGAIDDSLFRFDINLGPYLELYAASQADNAGGALGLGGGPIGLPQLPPAPPQHHVFNQGFQQHGSTLAAFQETKWRFLPSWALQFGLRVSHEEKEADWRQTFDTSPDPALNTLGLEEFTESHLLSEMRLFPKVVLGYEPTSSINLFVHWARGFKGGGFNAFAYRNVEDELVYDPETTTEIGIDLKASFLEDTLRPNVSLYRMDARDFQVLGRVKPPGVIGLGTTKVFNAPRAVAQGVEGDVTWLPFGGMNVFGTLGYNHTNYDSFPNNECSADDTATYCDATGKPFAFAPRWDSTLTPSYVWGLPFWGLSLTPSFTVQYIGSQLLDTDLDSRKRQSGFFRYHTTIAVANLAQGWSLQVVGNNLTDKRTSIRYGDLIPNTFIAVPEPAREFFVQARWTF